MGHESAFDPRVTAVRDAALGASARRRLLVAAGAGAVAAAVAAAARLLPWALVALTGWDVTAGVLICWNWATIARRDAEQTAKLAAGDDPTAAWSDFLLLSAAIASLAAVGLVLLGTGAGSELVTAALAVLSVALSWALVHTVFTLRYAALYYAGPDGGVHFDQDEPPDYLDFAYLAFTIGMTFQVSDTDLQSSAVRHTALRHALLSYVFGTVILAGTINLLAGLTR